MAKKVETKEEIKLDFPKMYKVILLNDDYTTMEFVVEILIDIFQKNELEAIDIMLNIHRNGKGVCGIYPYDIAETKILQVRNRARKEEYPLRAIIEEE